VIWGIECLRLTNKRKFGASARHFSISWKMSARNRVFDDFNIEQPAKRQKTEHNGGVVVNPFELLEFVEAIVAHLLIISPLSILNITCCSKR
jgi:hypothetical protein